MSNAIAKRIDSLTFDVFGTVVDWRSSIIREGETFGAENGLSLDWVAFADAWRGLYQPQMETVRAGKRPWVALDTLHRESLETLLARHGVLDISEKRLDHFNRAWHRLDPWPDTVSGLTRMKRGYPLATLSNGNVALMMNLARHGGLPWDAILGAEVCGHYKPCPEAYRRTAAFLGLPTERVMLVAAHNSDLVAAKAEGYRTAFVYRPTEYGPNQDKDLEPEHDFDFVARDLEDLAAQLGL